MKLRCSLIKVLVVVDLICLGLSPARGESPASKDPFVDSGKIIEVADLFAWTTADAASVNLVATMRVARGIGWRFPKGTSIVFHIASGPTYGTAGSETKLLCHFYDFDAVECWLGDGYVVAKAGVVAGGVSSDGRLRVFAGLRDDPAFFDRGALEAASAQVLKSSAVAPPVKDQFGCLAPNPIVSQTGRWLYAPDPKKVIDAHEGRNVMALVVQVPAAMLTAGGPILGVWVSAHAAK